MKATCNNMLFITSKNLTLEGVKEYLALALLEIVEVARKYGVDDLDTNYEMSYPRDKNFCYVWFNSTEVVNLFTGYKPDGSRNVEYREPEGDSWYDEEIDLGAPYLVPFYKKDQKILVEKAHVNINEDSENTIFCRLPVGQSITPREIKDIFMKFNVSNREKDIKVNFSKNGLCFVEFPSGNYDALFAQKIKMFTRVDGSTLKFIPVIKK